MTARQQNQEIHHEWFNDAKFGMFIHWGIYSVLGRGEQVLLREHLDPNEYAKNAFLFTAEKFSAEEWVSVAASSGVKYMVLTSKHHDGFCLFNTETTDYNSFKTGAKRDIVSEFMQACKKHGIKAGLYYSLADWRFTEYFQGPQVNPDRFSRFIEYVHTQVEELCSNYGELSLLWFDGDWPYDADRWQSVRLVEMIKKLQPNIIINNRLPKPKEGGDWGYLTPEGYIGAGSQDQMVESCLTSGRYWWGYLKGEKFWKQPAEIIASLVNALDGGGNFLFNIGPKPDGTFPDQFVDSLKEVGKWIRANGKAIYGSNAGIVDVSTLGFMATKPGLIYLFILYWPGDEAHIAGIRSKVVSVEFVATREKISFCQENEHVFLKGLRGNDQDPYCTVIEMIVDGELEAYPWAKNLLWSGDPQLLADWASLNEQHNIDLSGREQVPYPILQN